MKQLSLRGILLICGFLGVFCVSALAQEATIVGTVSDPSNAAVPNVAIRITNTDTNQVRHISSNEAGQFVVPDLHIGHYVVRAEAAGFKVAERTDIVLAVGDRTRVDFKLELGSTQQSITVEATPVAVQSDTGEISAVITGLQVASLATNGRSVYTLAVLTPGASSNMPDFQAPTAVGANSNISFNGMRQNHNLWLADGGEQSDRGGAGGLIIMPSMDSIAEFRVMTSNYSPEYGLSSAGTMNLVFKSGTKQLHASAWEFLRNDYLDAVNPFTNAAGQKAPKLRLNTFGFNVGGPVVLPGYNKNRDKTFFFYNMEWRKMIQGGVKNQLVPLPSTYGGAFATGLAAADLHTPCTNQVSAAMATQMTAAGQTLSTPDAVNGSCTVVPREQRTVVRLSPAIRSRPHCSMPTHNSCLTRAFSPLPPAATISSAPATSPPTCVKNSFGSTITSPKSSLSLAIGSMSREPKATSIRCGAAPTRARWAPPSGTPRTAA